MQKRIALLAAVSALATLAAVIGGSTAGASSAPSATARSVGGHSSGTFVRSFAPPAACNPCLYYSGDFDPNDPNANGLANEVDAIVTTGSYQYTPVTPNTTWHVTGLFVNTLSGLTPTNATWEIRTGVSEGNGGTLVASGSGAVTQTATGRSGFGFQEYTDSVAVSVVLNADTTYWINVTPVCAACDSRAFESNVPPGTAANHVGPTNILNLNFWNSAFFGVNFTNSNNGGSFPLMSFGVIGTVNPTITVTKHLVSNSLDPAKFNLRIDGVTYAANVGDGGTTGAITVAPGTHTVSETPGVNANMSNYQARISCSDGSAGYGTSLQVTVALGDSLSCTITNTRKLFKV
jgi:prealbumin domain-containing protein